MQLTWDVYKVIYVMGNWVKAKQLKLFFSPSFRFMEGFATTLMTARPLPVTNENTKLTCFHTVCSLCRLWLLWLRINSIAQLHIFLEAIAKIATKLKTIMTCVNLIKKAKQIQCRAYGTRERIWSLLWFTVCYKYAFIAVYWSEIRLQITEQTCFMSDVRVQGESY